MLSSTSNQLYGKQISRSNSEISVQWLSADIMFYDSSGCDNVDQFCILKQEMINYN